MSDMDAVRASLVFFWALIVLFWCGITWLRGEAPLWQWVAIFCQALLVGAFII